MFQVQARRPFRPQLASTRPRPRALSVQVSVCVCVCVCVCVFVCVCMHIYTYSANHEGDDELSRADLRNVSRGFGTIL